MNKLQRSLLVAALSLSASSARAGCLLSNAAFQNAAFALQSAPFTATFDAVPNAARMDGVIGLSAGPASGFTGQAAIVRFNNAGTIDARNGSAYAAAAAVPYSPGANYKFRLYVNPGTRRYNVYVTPPGGAERTLAYNYAFRTEQAATSSLGFWSAAATSGSHQVCNMAAGSLSSPAGDISAPSVTWYSPAVGSTVSGAEVRVEARVTDDKGVAGVQFKLDGVNLGAEDTASPYAVKWDTTKSANGLHTLSVVARDAAGNRTSAGPVSVSVNNAAAGSPMSASSVRQLYPSLSGGKAWYSKWDNGTARTMISGAYDSMDSWIRARGNGTHKIDGKGLLKMSGAAPRLYIVDPSQGQWRNVEITVYAMRVSDSNSMGGIVSVARTNHTAPDHALCDSRGIGSRFHYTGKSDFHKETAHHTAESVKSVNSKTLYSSGLPYNKWIGYKYVVYDLPNGNVKLEAWRDEGETGNWVKVNEFEDNGSNLGVGATPCGSGINPALRLTQSPSRQGSETGKPNLAVYFRSDNVGTDGLIYKRMSVREIQP